MVNLIRLAQLCHDKAAAVNFLQQVNILPNPRHCTRGHPMTLELRDKGDRWRCSLRACRQEFSVRKGTWIEGSKLSFEKIILHLYCWSETNYSIRFLEKELEFKKEAIIDYNNYCREICAKVLLANPPRIGGPGKTVEIDESLFVRRKYNRGRMLQQQWVFGGICREDQQSFLYCVDARDAATLLPIIQNHVLPGTTILSDEWAAYRQIQALGYQHNTVNHSLTFVDPVTGAHTQNVESHWRHAKQRSKTQYGTHRTMVDSYMCEWMWRQRNKGQDLFIEILTDIAAHYPPPQ